MPEHNFQYFSDNQHHVIDKVIRAIDCGHDLAFIENWSVSQLASCIESISVRYRRSIIAALPSNRYWELMHALQYDTAKHIHKSLNKKQVTERVKFLTEFDLITFAEFFPQSVVDQFLLEQSEPTAQFVQTALTFKDDEVGRYTVLDYVTGHPNLSVGALKERKISNNNKVQAVIVKDGERVTGIVPPEVLLSATNNTKLSAIQTKVSIIEASQNVYEVGKQLNLDGQTHWFPVQDQGKLIGVIPLYVLMNALRELGLQAVVAENVKSEEDLFTPLKVAARLRALWLVINLLTAFAASAIIGLFDDVIEQVVALAILMPVVASMGGIAGSQTLAVSLRGIALNHLHQSNVKLLLHKELKIALLNGLVLGALIGIVVYLVFDVLALALIIFCAISINSLAAAASATLIPFTLKKFNIDPAVAGSVILTTVTDVVGFLVFLGLGAMLLL